MLESFIDWAHANGLGFYITEFDIFRKKQEVETQEETAKAYGVVLETLLSKRKRGEVGWNTWNLSDEDHYRDKNKMVLGMWDENFQPKKAYFEVRRVLLDAR